MKFDVKIIAIMALAGVVAYLLVSGMVNKGGVGVSLGYILSDGTEVALQDGASLTIFRDLNTLRWYSDASKTQVVTALWGELKTNPETTAAGNVTIVWARVVKQTVTASGVIQNPTGISGSEGGGNMSVPPNVWTTINGSRYTYTLPVGAFDVGTREFTWFYDVTATQGGLSASVIGAEGRISCYWQNETLTLWVSMNKGTLQLV